MQMLIKILELIVNKIYMRNKETQDFLEVKIPWKTRKEMMKMNMSHKS